MFHGRASNAGCSDGEIHLGFLLNWFMNVNEWLFYCIIRLMVKKRVMQHLSVLILVSQMKTMIINRDVSIHLFCKNTANVAYSAEHRQGAMNWDWSSWNKKNRFPVFSSLNLVSCLADCRAIARICVMTVDTTVEFLKKVSCFSLLGRRLALVK